MPTASKQYRRQVEVVEGFQYDGTNSQDVIDFTGGAAVMQDDKLMLKHPGGQYQEIHPTNWILHDPWESNFVMADADFKIVYAPGPN
jgi:hypothetical protein